MSMSTNYLTNFIQTPNLSNTYVFSEYCLKLLQVSALEYLLIRTSCDYHLFEINDNICALPQVNITIEANKQNVMAAVY